MLLNCRISATAQQQCKNSVVEPPKHERVAQYPEKLFVSWANLCALRPHSINVCMICWFVCKFTQIVCPPLFILCVAGLKW